MPSPKRSSNMARGNRFSGYQQPSCSYIEPSSPFPHLKKGSCDLIARNLYVKETRIQSTEGLSPLLFPLSFGFPLHFSLVVFQPNCSISHLGMQSVSPHLFSTFQHYTENSYLQFQEETARILGVRKKKENSDFSSKMKPVSVGRGREILDVIRSNCVLTLHRIISPIIEN